MGSYLIPGSLGGGIDRESFRGYPLAPMQCPNCSSQEPDGAAECRSCNIIFEKWRQRAAAPAAAPPAEAAASAAAAAVSGTPWLSIALGALVAVGGGGTVLYQTVLKKAVGAYVTAQMEANSVKDSAKALEAADRIMLMEVPGGAEGVVSSEASLFSIRIRMAVLRGKEARVVMLLMGARGFDDAKDNSAEMAQKKLADKFTIESTEVRKSKISGQDADVRVSRGYMPIDPKSAPPGAPARVAVASWTGSVLCAKDRITVVGLAFGEGEEAALPGVFASLKCLGS